ncbi:MAG: hypothetical protein HC925_04505, partial [Coleofasciculaceae cyanobacterium SM2_3_26]|nr:hypothetical protein [Coleofasciculaceae cyanobacterium SM2_3_26]
MAAPPSSSGGTSPVLKLGLAALQQKRYAEAVGHLEEACQANLIPKHRLQAKQALAIAYEKRDNLPKLLKSASSCARQRTGNCKPGAIAPCKDLQKTFKRTCKKTFKKLAT